MVLIIIRVWYLGWHGFAPACVWGSPESPNEKAPCHERLRHTALTGIKHCANGFMIHGNSTPNGWQLSLFFSRLSERRCCHAFVFCSVPLFMSSPALCSGAAFFINYTHKILAELAKQISNWCFPKFYKAFHSRLVQCSTLSYVEHIQMLKCKSQQNIQH